GKPLLFRLAFGFASLCLGLLRSLELRCESLCLGLLRGLPRQPLLFRLAPRCRRLFSSFLLQPLLLGLELRRDALCLGLVRSLLGEALLFRLARGGGPLLFRLARGGGALGLGPLRPLCGFLREPRRDPLALCLGLRESRGALRFR